jgi:ketosteroid isomerase-like protein
MRPWLAPSGNTKCAVRAAQDAVVTGDSQTPLLREAAQHLTIRRYRSPNPREAILRVAGHAVAELSGLFGGGRGSSWLHRLQIVAAGGVSPAKRPGLAQIGTKNGTTVLAALGFTRAGHACPTPGYAWHVASNSEVVKAWVDACNQGDVDLALALCDPSIELVEATALPGAVTATGIDAVRRYLERFAAHWSEGEWLPEEIRESGDKVFMGARLRLRGRRSGIEVNREWIYVFTLRQGKLFSQEGFDDRADGLLAAGIKAA